MILFIIIALLILYMFTADLIREIRVVNVSFFDHVKSVWGWFWMNITLNIVNCFVVFCLSCLLFFGLHFICPSETSQWQFNINAMQDNLGVEGRFRYGGRGYINDELSYYYSRTMANGELIEHIPADKTYVRYSNDEKPHVEVHQSRLDIPDWMYKVFFLEWMNSPNTKYYVMVVPEGTITNAGQYEIDMR
jgi:hypothetical protein